MKLTDLLPGKKSVGLEIASRGLSCALLGGTSQAPLLERVAFRPLATGVLRPSLRDPNVLDGEAFSRCLAEVHSLLLHRGTRLSVTLPDGVGRVFLMDVEGRFKNRGEALDIIRWKLKKSMPFDVNECHLDYQQLKVRENNDLALLVAMASRSVIAQYEELMVVAGFSPARIDLNAFNICRVFEKRLALLEECILVAHYEGSLTMVVIHDGVPEFFRLKDLGGTHPCDNRVFREVSNSLLAYRERNPERPPHRVACLAAPDVLRDFCDMVAEATTFETVPLEVKTMVTSSEQAPTDQPTLFPFTAAIGAALRSL